MCLKGEGGRKDINKALDLLEKSCVKGDKTGCSQLVELRTHLK